MALENKLDFKTVYKTTCAFPYREDAQTTHYGGVVKDTVGLDLLVDARLQEYVPNFSIEMVVCAFQGQRTSGGYSIEITDIVEKEDKIVALATVVEPSGGMATQSITYPAHFVACKKSDKPVEFVWSVKDTYAKELAACKKYMVSPKEREHPPELSPNARTSREERIRIMKEQGQEVYGQLKKDCEQIGIPTNFNFLDTISMAFIDLEDSQVKALQDRGYNVEKSA